MTRHKIRLARIEKNIKPQAREFVSLVSTDYRDDGAFQDAIMQKEGDGYDVICIKPVNSKGVVSFKADICDPEIMAECIE